MSNPEIIIQFLREKINELEKLLSNKYSSEDMISFAYWLSSDGTRSHTEMSDNRKKTLMNLLESWELEKQKKP